MNVLALRLFLAIVTQPGLAGARRVAALTSSLPEVGGFDGTKTLRIATQVRRRT
jgi:hypothetical protein